jgi:hypothetical protein
MRIWAIIFAFVALQAPEAIAQRITMDTLSLYRLPGVWVQVSPLGPDAERDGLNADSLGLIIERSLADAGVRIFSQSEWQQTLGNPMLELSINLVHPSPFLYLYNIRLELKQLSALQRDSIPVFGTTWTAGDVLGTVSAENISSLDRFVGRMASQFVDAFVAARRYERPGRRRVGQLEGLGASVVTCRGGRTAVGSSSNRLSASTETLP